MKLPKIFKNQKGFTLIELLVVIGILAILLVITIIAVNPPRQLGKARDTQRRSDVLAILNAMSQYYAEEGEFPTTGLPTIPFTNALIAVDDGAGTDEADICASIVGATGDLYLSAMPYDPSASGAGYTNCTNYDTKYTLSIDNSNRVTVTAPETEQETTDISVTR
ncbi:MAG: hypothetical protein A2Y57_02195 [Candidatus Woykebacteria bacterium RBG_13_40_7b]|uniref:Type II secretion system protein GspG C-terminal domain-containing protein n=1 Tax=Candidatus Woykebacteria bacterium RBG_13_40_7b TaxID=1802594 RepID=A0A1G1W8N1_9BACT|nr:MAG: hypothetical protein A2Y57_02195 [Candidatus Woykebacteria bacterium RBG_13_40_7b]